MEQLIRPIAELQTTRSWAVYGRSGTGKTTFASTFPGPTLLLDIEDHGTDSIADQKHVDVAQITKWDQFTEIYDLLTAKKCKYKTVVFDTITQMQILGANHVLSKKRKPAIEQLDWGSMTMQDYGDLAALMKEKITLFRNLSIGVSISLEVVFLAQERVTNNESDDSTVLLPEVGPALTPSIASHLNAAVTVIASTYIKRRRRKLKNNKDEIIPIYALRIGPSPIYTTKVRKPRAVELPPDIDDPTWKDVVDIIEGRE